MLYVYHTVAPLQLVLTLNFLNLDLKQVVSQTLSPFFAKFRNPVIIVDLKNTVILIFFYDTNIFPRKLQPGGMRFRFFFMTLSLICCWIEMVLLTWWPEEGWQSTEGEYLHECTPEAQSTGQARIWHHISASWQEGPGATPRDPSGHEDTRSWYTLSINVCNRLNTIIRHTLIVSRVTTLNIIVRGWCLSLGNSLIQCGLILTLTHIHTIWALIKSLKRYSNEYLSEGFARWRPIDTFEVRLKLHSAQSL